MLEPERMADLVDDGVVVVVALYRVDARVAEPDVAGGDMAVRIVRIGGAGVGVVAEPHGRVAGVLEVGDAEVGEALDRVALVAGLAREIALHLVAALLCQKCKLTFGFDAFRQDGDIEAMSERDDCADDCHGMMIVFEIADKYAIDLDFLERECVQVGQGGVSRSEVIQRDMDAEQF